MPESILPAVKKRILSKARRCLPIPHGAASSGFPAGRALCAVRLQKPPCNAAQAMIFSARAAKEVPDTQACMKKQKS